MAPRTHHFKGKVKREASADTAAYYAGKQLAKQNDASKKAQQQARAAEALRQSRQMNVRGGKEAAMKTRNQTEMLRMLAGGTKSVLLKMVWASWQVFIVLSHEEKELKHRDALWRMSCNCHTGTGGPCAAHGQLHSSTHELPPIGPAASGGKRGGLPLLPWNVAKAAMKFLRPVRGDGASGRGTIAKKLAGKAAEAFKEGGGLGKDVPLERAAAPILRGGDWHAAFHHGTGKTVWYNKHTGQMCHNDYEAGMLPKTSTGRAPSSSHAATIARETEPNKPPLVWGKKPDGKLMRY